jgi:ABC-2 type transport system permease protein/lipopolysaccharide transport system permease protein
VTGIQAAPELGTPTPEAGGPAVPENVPASPRPEIRFRRRVSLGAAVAEIWGARELVRTLAERDLRARYKQTVLGFAWAVVTPLLMMGVFTLVFTRFAKVNTSGIPYPLFSFTGVVIWTFFSNAVGSGGGSIVGNLALVNKVYCPREVFPIAAICVAFVDAIIAACVLGLLFAVLGTAPKPEIVYMPPLLGVLVLFTLGVTLLVSVLLVYLRDLRHALPLMLQAALFVTPVAYTIQPKSRPVDLLYSALNPVAPVIEGLRNGALYGKSPDWTAVGVAALSSSLLIVFAFWAFKRLETGIADIA